VSMEKPVDREWWIVDGELWKSNCMLAACKKKSGGLSPAARY
jgi:hypothetical protein